MTFDEALAMLLGMVGQQVSVLLGAAEGGPQLAAVMSGTLEAGTQMRVASRADAEGEAFYFHFAEDPSAGFFLHATEFRGAERLPRGEALRMLEGPLQITVELDSSIGAPY